jgi:protoheme IX farnesyltransferase
MKFFLGVTMEWVVRKYGLLTKPGIVFGNVVTTVAGFALASRGVWNGRLFLAVLVGLSLIIMSACVWNNYIDRDLDAKMMRTKNRALAKGAISPKAAGLFAISLGLGGLTLLAFGTNLLAMLVAVFGFIMYVIVYSFSKYLVPQSTFIGSLAGAVPPVVGYTAVSHRLDLGAFLLFALMVMWQMPHFYAIAIYRIEDYRKGDLPLLPLKEGIRVTKFSMLFYVIGFISVASLLTLFHYVGYIFLVATLLSGIYWLILCIEGFSCKNDIVWARKMFIFSLVVVMVFSITISINVL